MGTYSFYNSLLSSASFVVHIVSVMPVFMYDVSFLIYYILTMSGDVEPNPGPRPTRHRQCRILYANIRGLHANLNDLVAASRQFDILLCSETLVSGMRHVSEVLIPSFKKPIFLRRNAIHRAQGMALYIRKDFSASRKANYECRCHEVQVLKVCGKTNNFYIFSVYRNPDADDSIYDCLLTSMAAIQESDRKAAFVFVGDFNAHHRDWLSSVSPTNCHGLKAFDFSSEAGCEQLVHKPTHRSGNCLDLVFTDVPGVVGCNVGTPIGTSDHSYVSITIRTEQTVPDVSFSRKIYIKSRADWDGILRDLSVVDWPDIYRQVDSISSLSAICNEIIDKRIPSRIINFRNRDKAWFNDECKRAYQEKQEAYHLWRRNRSELTWDNYIRLQAVAQRVYASAEKEYNDNIKDDLLGTSQPNKWWSTLKSALFGIDTTVPALLKPDGSLTHDPKEKATLFADVFDGKQSNEKLTIPQTCFPESILTDLAFWSRAIKNFGLER